MIATPVAVYDADGKLIGVVDPAKINPVEAAPSDETVTKAARAALAPIVEQLGKHAGLSDVLKGMQERIDYLTAMPADRPAPPSTDRPVDTLADLKKAADAETDPMKKTAAQNALTYASVAARFAQ
jgi:hypothetical protein